MTATLPSSFPITSPFVVSGRHLPPRTSKWVRRRQLLSVEARTSVVRNLSGWTTDQPPRSVSAVPALGRAFHIGYDNRPALLFRYVRRSVEHTSELQSRMRISYAVFCLQKSITSKETTKYKQPT